MKIVNTYYDKDFAILETEIYSILSEKASHIMRIYGALDAFIQKKISRGNTYAWVHYGRDCFEIKCWPVEFAESLKESITLEFECPEPKEPLSRMILIFLGLWR